MQTTDEMKARTLIIMNFPFIEFNEQKTLKQGKKLCDNWKGRETVYIRGIAYQNLEKEGQKELKSRVKIAKEKDYNKNIDCVDLYVRYKTIEEACIAGASIAGLKFHGHYLSVDFMCQKKANSVYKRTLFLRNLPKRSTDNEVWECFLKKGYPVENVRMVRNKLTRETQTYCYVTMENSEAARKAKDVTEKKPFKIGRKYLQVNISDRHREEVNKEKKSQINRIKKKQLMKKFKHKNKKKINKMAEKRKRGSTNRN